VNVDRWLAKTYIVSFPIPEFADLLSATRQFGQVPFEALVCEPVLLQALRVQAVAASTTAIVALWSWKTARVGISLQNQPCGTCFEAIFKK
jgi:hypothetical protein